MRRSTAVALCVFVMNLRLLAQHGGGHGSGFSVRSPASHAEPAFRSGAASVPRPSAMPSGPRFSAAKPPFSPGSRPGYGQRPSFALRRGPAVHYGAQPLNYGVPGSAAARGEHRSPYRSLYRHPDGGGIVYETPYARVAPYYFGYPYGLGFYGDYGFDADDTYGSSADTQAEPDYDQPYAPGQYNGFDPEGQQPAQVWPPNQDQAAGQGAGQLQSGSGYRPFYGTAERASAPASEPAVTLVFKDHRPNRQIHNYLIDGDTITVWDQSPHDIALDQLDIAATEKLNHDAGTDFYLPGQPR